MPRKGLFRRIVEGIVNSVVRRKPPQTPQPSKPTRPKPTRPTQASVVENKRQRAIDHLIANVPFANADEVEFNISQMTDEELDWTIKATPSQILNRARQDADRMVITDDGKIIPLNPWWYH